MAAKDQVDAVFEEAWAKEVGSDSNIASGKSLKTILTNIFKKL